MKIQKEKLDSIAVKIDALDANKAKLLREFRKELPIFVKSFCKEATEKMIDGVSVTGLAFDTSENQLDIYINTSGDGSYASFSELRDFLSKEDIKIFTSILKNFKRDYTKYMHCIFGDQYLTVKNTGKIIYLDCPPCGLACCCVKR